MESGGYTQPSRHTDEEDAEAAFKSIPSSARAFAAIDSDDYEQPLVHSDDESPVADARAISQLAFRRLTVGGLVLFGLLSAAVVAFRWRRSPSCVSRLDTHGLISLVEARHGDMGINFTADDDPDIIFRMLAEREAQSEEEQSSNFEVLKAEVLAVMQLAAAAPQAERTKAVDDLVTKLALEGLVKKAAQRQELQARLTARTKRFDLDDKVGEYTKNLRSHMRSDLDLKLGADGEAHKDNKSKLPDPFAGLPVHYHKAEELENITGKMNLSAKLPWPYFPYWGGPYVATTEYNFTRRIVQQHYVAFCTFNIANMISHVARMAMDINDAVQTCPAARYVKASGATCFLNVASAVTAVSWVASLLATAADQCAATLIPNIDANCASSISAMVGMISELSIGAALAGDSCTSRGIFVRQPGYVPASHVGKIIEKERRLSAENNIFEEFMHNKSKPGRRLLFGGGVASNFASCTVDITEVAWWLATFALFINGAVNSKTFGVCARSTLLGQPLLGFCIVDIAGAIFAFEQAAALIQMTIVHCSNQLDLPSLCGAGITMILSALSGVVSAGTGIYLSCAEYQPNKGVYTFGRQFDDFTGGLITRGVGNILTVYGRRLNAEDATKRFERQVEKVKKKFKTPMEVFEQMGFDSKDEKWRESVDRSMRKPLDLFQVHRDSQESSAGPLHEQVCKA